MKKLLTITALMGLTSLSYGQGTVNFSAGASAATRLSYVTPFGTNAAISSAAGSYYFALFVGPTALGTNFGTMPGWNDPTANGFSLVSYGTNSGVLGRMTGNPDTAGTVVNGFGAGTSANFVVLGWSANIGGPNYSAFQAWANGSAQNPDQFWGHSLVASNVQLGGGLIPPGNIFGAGAGQIPGFVLSPPIPEPSTFALAGLGAAALVIFRRRKQ